MNNLIKVKETFGRHRSASLRLGNEKHHLDLFAVAEFARLGMQAIVDDEVTKRFAAKELKTWNLLTRTDKFYHYKSLRLAFIWWTGMIFRYFIMFPIRGVISIVGVSWLISTAALISLIPDGKCPMICFSRYDNNYYASLLFELIERLT